MGILPSLIQRIRPIKRSGSFSRGWCGRSNIYLPCAGALVKSEDGNTIGEAMVVVRSWLRELGQDWKIRYCLTDDSAAEQRAIQIAFPEDDSVYGRVDHLFCKWHSKQTLDRNLHGDILNAVNEQKPPFLTVDRKLAASNRSMLPSTRFLMAHLSVERRSFGIPRNIFRTSG